MELSQQLIDDTIRIYNGVTKAHKRPPVETYVRKRLEQGDSLRLSSGKKRWSSAIEFSGAPENVDIEFIINPALPERFKKELQKMKTEFDAAITQTISS